MITIETGPEIPKPYQRMIAEERYHWNSETGKITNKQKTGIVRTRREWAVFGYRFARWNRAMTWVGLKIV